MTTRKHPHEPHEPHERAHSGETSESAAAGSPPAEAKMEAKIAELEAAAAEAKDRHIRLAADFDNYKRRSRMEQLDTIQHASAELIARLLPGLDDLHKALEHTPAGTDQGWAKGLELSVRKLEEALATHGLETIEAVGRPFDPKFHEAIGDEESAEHPENTVVEELRRGYRIRDRVVRPALVKVSRLPAVPAPGGGSADSELDLR